MKWFKFYGQDYISDPKMLSLTPSDRSCWITILSYASINDNGMITFLSEQQLMAQAGLDPTQEEWDKTIGILEKLKKLEMIGIDNGMITVKNWQKRQETNLTSYERLKRYRQKKRTNVINDNAKITLDKKRIDKNIIEEKDIYGEFKKVSLTQEEHNKLISKIGENNTKILITELDGYIKSLGKKGENKYSSHYAVIQNWARRRVLEHQTKLKDKEKKFII